MFIYNTHHGCHKYSEGCKFCYMYSMDKAYGVPQNSSVVTKLKASPKPLAHYRSGEFKIPSFCRCYVNLSSDTFIEEADAWRDEMWEVFRKRPDVLFSITTKRIERVAQCLPADWGDGYDNVELITTCENQECADKRLPIVRNLPFKHKSIMVAPFIGPVMLLPYLSTGEFDYVLCEGENYESNRVLDYDWVLSLHEQCLDSNTNFIFLGIGNYFRKDGKVYHVKSKDTQHVQAYKAGLNIFKNDILYDLYYTETQSLQPMPVIAYFNDEKCPECEQFAFCEGCNLCGKCSLKSKALNILKPLLVEKV